MAFTVLPSCSVIEKLDLLGIKKGYHDPGDVGRLSSYINNRYQKVISTHTQLCIIPYR
jgi:hypothetical protein